VAHGIREVLPRCIEREVQLLRETEHHAAVPRVRLVVVRLFDETSPADAPPRVRNEQLGVRQLVHTESTARATGAFRIVEDEKRRSDVAVDEMVCRTAQRFVEAIALGFAESFENLNLDQAVAYEQRGGDRSLDGLLLLSIYSEAIDDGIHVADLRV